MKKRKRNITNTMLTAYVLFVVAATIFLFTTNPNVDQTLQAIWLLSVSSVTIFLIYTLNLILHRQDVMALSKPIKDGQERMDGCYEDDNEIESEVAIKYLSNRNKIVKEYEEGVKESVLDLLDFEPSDLVESFLLTTFEAEDGSSFTCGYDKVKSEYNKFIAEKQRKEKNVQ